MLAEVLPRAYPYLQDLDLESATNNSLRQAFASYIGREPETLRNAETSSLPRVRGRTSNVGTFFPTRSSRRRGREALVAGC